MSGQATWAGRASGSHLPPCGGGRRAKRAGWGVAHRGSTPHPPLRGHLPHKGGGGGRGGSRCLAIAIAVLLLSGGRLAAEEWPRWGGPRGDWTRQAPKLPAQWPAGGPKVVWKRAAGAGYAGLTTAEGKLYVFDFANGEERITCHEATTGKPLWSHEYAVKYGELGGYANGPRAQPTYHDGRLYTLGAVGHVLCLDAKTGEVVWKHDAVAAFGAKVPEWGLAGSPVIDGERVFLHVGSEAHGCVLALDRTTGRKLWQSVRDPAGYCTPVLIRSPSGNQLVIWTPFHVHGLDPENGRVLWSVPYKVTYGVSIATPIFRDGLLFVSGYWEGSKAIRLGARPTDAELAWADTRNLRGLMCPPLYRDGHVYLLDKGNGMTCFELKTGKKLWDDANSLTPPGRNPQASVVWLGDGDRALALNSAGELVLCRLNPNGYEEDARAKVLGGRVWGHPAFAGRFLFAKTDGGEAWRKAECELACVELVGE